jgi:RimJ/RimL family protein N-acetyltransferase
MPEQSVRIAPLDLTDDKRCAAYAELHRQGEAAGDDYPVAFQPRELRAFLGDVDGTERWLGLLGEDAAGTPVVAGLLVMPLSDNLDKAEVAVWVARDHLRRGYGTAMAKALVQQASEHRRTTLTAHVNTPIGADDSHPHRAFASQQGFTLSNSELHRILELPVPEHLLAELAASVATKHADYRLVEYVDDQIPAELLPSYLDLINALMVDAPTGDVDYEPGGMTAETFVTETALMQSQGRILYRTIAIDAEGLCAAHSVLCVPGQDPGKIFQFGTLVRREHRGHGLGLATKVRNIATVQALHPDRQVVHTWNAASNAHMVAVNEAMGFRVVGESGEYVRRLAD